MMPKPPRPTGVTILGALSILAGIIGIIGGAAILGLSGFVATAGFPGGAAFVAAIGGFLLIIAILELVYGFGLLGGKGWAWTLAMIGSVLNIIGGIVSLALGSAASIGGLIIAIIILYYLTRPRVKAYFGKGSMPQGAMPTMPMGSMGSMPMGGTGSMGTGAPMGQAQRFCRSCGASLPAGATRCPNCGASV